MVVRDDVLFRVTLKKMDVKDNEIIQQAGLVAR